MPSAQPIQVQPVAALYCRTRSVYHTLPGVHVWDAVRDARTYPGGMPIVAHPPCRLWGRLRTFSRAGLSDKAHGDRAVAQLIRWGGVLEHPAHSQLWYELGLPLPGAVPASGSLWSMSIDQAWWGHRARKATWLLLSKVDPRTLPPWSPSFNPPSHVVSRSRGRQHIREVNKSEREATPPALAAWLVACARTVPTLNAALPL